MKIANAALVILLSAATAYATVHFTANESTSAAKEDALARVMRTGILRCAYYVFAPFTTRDPNTGTLSGLSIDMMEHISENSSLKIEWVEQIDFANWTPGLKSKRYDAICTPMWPEITSAREVLFTRPMFYAGINVYARGDDHRFDNNLDAINNPDVTIAVIEGNATAFIAHNVFPKAKTLESPENSAGGISTENVVTKKADIFFWDENGVHDFLKTNPGGIHNVAPGHPVKTMPFELVVDTGEERLRDFLDATLQSLDDTGYTNMLLNKWELNPGDFYRMAKPFVIDAK